MGGKRFDVLKEQKNARKSFFYVHDHKKRTCELLSLLAAKHGCREVFQPGDSVMTLCACTASHESPTPPISLKMTVVKTHSRDWAGSEEENRRTKMLSSPDDASAYVHLSGLASAVVQLVNCLRTNTSFNSPTPRAIAASILLLSGVERCCK